MFCFETEHKTIKFYLIVLLFCNIFNFTLLPVNALASDAVKLESFDGKIIKSASGNFLKFNWSGKINNYKNSSETVNIHISFLDSKDNVLWRFESDPFTVDNYGKLDVSGVAAVAKNQLELIESVQAEAQNYLTLQSWPNIPIENNLKKEHPPLELISFNVAEALIETKKYDVILPADGQNVLLRWSGRLKNNREAEITSTVSLLDKEKKIIKKVSFDNSYRKENQYLEINSTFMMSMSEWNEVSLIDLKVNLSKKVISAELPDEVESFGVENFHFFNVGSHGDKQSLEWRGKVCSPVNNAFFAAMHVVFYDSENKVIFRHESSPIEIDPTDSVFSASGFFEVDENILESTVAVVAQANSYFTFAACSKTLVDNELDLVYFCPEIASEVSDEAIYRKIEVIGYDLIVPVTAGKTASNVLFRWKGVVSGDKPLNNKDGSLLNVIAFVDEFDKAIGAYRVLLDLPEDFSENEAAVVEFIKVKFSKIVDAKTIKTTFKSLRGD